MFMPTGGGGKGNRPQSIHQQNHNHQSQHHQASHAHSHTHHYHQNQQQQSRISHLPHQQQDHQQQQQQQQPTHVFVPQQGTVSNLGNLANLHQQHHPLPQQQQQLQQQQQHHQLQQQQIIFYSSQPPPPLPYSSRVQHTSSSSSNGSNGGSARQLSRESSSNSLGHASHPHGHNNPLSHGQGHTHANGVLTPTNSNANVVRSVSNSTLQSHFTPPAGLIAPAGGNGGGGATTYISTAYVPFTHPGQLVGAPPMGFATNGAPSSTPGAFYTTAPPQKQLPAGQQHGVGVGVSAGAMPNVGQAPSIAYYHTALPPAPLNNSSSNSNNSISGGGSNGSQRGNIRGGQRSTPPQQTSFYTTYAVPTSAPPPIPALVNNAATAAVAPIINTRNNVLNGSAAYHLQASYCPNIPIGPPPNLTPTPIIGTAGLTAPPPAASTGLHTYAPILQSNSATSVQAVPGVAGTFLPNTLTTAQQLSGADLVKKRRHAIPIIHPDTKENVLDPTSSVFNKQDSNCNLTSSPGSDANFNQYQSPVELESSSSSAILMVSGSRINYPIETEIASTSQGFTANQGVGSECASSSTSAPLTDEDKVSVIVKDILANTRNPEAHLEFWQLNDVDNASENASESNTESCVNEVIPVVPPVGPAGISGRPSVAVLFHESKPESSSMQRSKSANEQGTAMPNSIANECAEAIAIPEQRNISVVASPDQLAGGKEVQNWTTNLSSRGSAELSPTDSTLGQHKQTSSGSNAFQLASNSSSAASTPTHQQKPQHVKETAVVSAAAPDPVVAAVAPSNMSRKNQRKVQKRKEQEKKKQKAAATITNTSTANSSSNNNGNNNNISNNAKSGAVSNAKGNNCGASTNADVSITTFATTTSKLTTTNAVASVMVDKAMAPPTTDKLSATSNNSSLSFSLREKQPKDRTGNSSNHNEEATGEQIFDYKKCSLNDSTKQQTNHMATEDIVAKFLQKNSDDKSNQSEPQLEFLNSSSSVCEDEETASIIDKCKLSRVDEHKAENIQTCGNVNELKFGDFNEETTPAHTSFICSSTWSSSQLTDAANSQSSHSEDNVDCAPKSNMLKNDVSNNATNKTASKKISSAHQIEKSGTNQKSSASKSAGGATKSPSTTIKLIRYNIEQLRELSKLSDSRKPPLVPCQKGDCIAQLFVSRQSQQQQQHQHHHGHNQHGQQYQHAHESMDYMSGKRGRGHGHNANKKHHDNYQSMGGNSSGNSSSGGGGMGNSNQRYNDIIRVQLSLKEEIKLSECENAWQPETLRRMSMFNTTEADKDNDMDGVLKKVRGILNKLTPDNFEVLLKEMSSIKMDTQRKMTNVMLLIFEKTISEPNFAPTYARFCKVLFHEIKAENKSLFTSSLITRIQHEFESNVNDANAKAKKLQPTQDRINACTDAAKKIELRAEMEDLEYQFRRRAWGTVRFIGELFKLQSLTSDRVLHCVESLLEHGCEEKLEYMCKLLTTVGHLLEAGPSEQYSSGARIEKIFRRIQDIVQRSRTNTNRQHQTNIKISSRVRFMMQDVLDLRLRNWDQPAASQPTSGNRQRHKQNDDAKSQQQQQQHGGRGGYTQQQQNNYQYQQQKQQHHGGHQSHESGNYFMQKLPKAQQQENQSVSIDPNKLRFISGSNDDGTAKLGNSSHYQWRNVGNRPVSAATTFTQPSLLKRPPSSGSFNYSQYQHQPPSVMSNPLLSTRNNNNNNNATAAAVETNFDSKQCQQLLTKLVEEVVSSRGNWQNEVLAIWRDAVSKQLDAVAVLHYVLMDYVHRATVKRQQRLACANVFAYLMEEEAFNKATFAQAYNRFGEEFPDLLVDVPNGWTYVFEFLGPIMHSGHLEFKDIWQRRWLEDSHFTERFARSFVSYFVQEFGAGYAHKLWHVDSKLDRGQIFWGDARKYRDFLQSNGFQFLDPYGAGTANLQRPKVTRTPADHVERISYLLSLSNDTAIDYINTNVHININFVRQLTKYLCCDFALTLITNPTTKTNNSNNNNNSNRNNMPLQLNVEVFKMQCTPLLRLCIDAQEAHEIACIEVIVESLQQHFLVEVENEMAAGESICNAWSVLYDCEVISRDSFHKWFKRESDKPGTCRRPLMIKLGEFIEEM